MIYGYSNYTNSVNSYSKYNYNVMKSSYSTANTAGVRSVSPAYKNSYVNSDAMKALTNIRNNASALMDSLDVMTQSTTFNKMYDETSKAENIAANSDNTPDSAYDNTQAEAEETANVSKDTRVNANQSAAARVNGKAQTDARQTAVSEDAAKSTADAAKNFVGSFNGLMDAAKSNSRLTGDLTGTYDTYASSLKNLGITANSDGTLAVDTDKLDRAASDGSLESFFTIRDGNNSGFTERLSKIASTAEKGGYGAVSSSSSGSSSAYAQNLANINGYGRNNYDRFYNYMYGASGGSTIGALFNLYA